MTVDPDWRDLLVTRWRATASGPFFGLDEPPPEFLQILPADYLDVVATFGGREGFIGETYLRLYRLNELIALNLAYEVPSFSPEIIVFGSNGGGDAFAFPLGDSAVIQVPLIPLASEYAKRRADSFAKLVQSLAASGESAACKAEAVGMEAHEINPICFGGSPTDPTNKVLVPIAKHAELCRFWNKAYRNAAARRDRAKS